MLSTPRHGRPEGQKGQKGEAEADDVGQPGPFLPGSRHQVAKWLQQSRFTFFSSNALISFKSMSCPEDITVETYTEEDISNALNAEMETLGDASTADSIAL